MRLQDYKALHRLTAPTLAARIGYPLSTVEAWLHEFREPSPPAILAIVKATGGAVRTQDLRRDLAEAAEIERAAIVREPPATGSDHTQCVDSDASRTPRKFEAAA
jgi:DNA-binding transcriptional regulator YdaS (Cro superfamily)